VVIRKQMGELKMKTLSYILVVSLLVLGSCTSSLYTGTEYDDLYYQSTDKPVTKVRPSASDQIPDASLKSGDLYDNIYAADTLVSDEYSNAVDYDQAAVDNNYDNNGSGYDYYNNYSYTGRLRSFYGNYFDPYWRDPFYFSYGYPYSGYGYGYGYPYFNDYGFYGMDPYSWNHYYDYGMGYGFGFGGLYGGYWGGYYGGFPYYYSGYYGSAYLREGGNHSSYGRFERPSTLSSRWNSSVVGYGSARRNSYLSSGAGRRTTSSPQGLTNDQRRTYSSGVNTQQPVTQSDRKSGQNQSRVNSSSTQRNAANTRSVYNSSSRTYTPSYSSPRMSTRPSYNNSRVSSPEGSSRSNQGTYQNPANKDRKSVV
jgi:hypothetical protein